MTGDERDELRLLEELLELERKRDELELRLLEELAGLERGQS